MTVSASRVESRDGTPIAFERTGQGPALVLVDGAFGHRRFGPNVKLAPLLAERFTVYTYDRRGRGESGDTPPYAVEREVDDLAAAISEAGGAADVYGISSGGALALGDRQRRDHRHRARLPRADDRGQHLASALIVSGAAALLVAHSASPAPRAPQAGR